MRRRLIGLALVAHGLAHALPAAQARAAGASWLLTPMGVSPSVLRWIVAVLSATAMAGFVASGFGAWGAPVFRRRWRDLARAAAVSSLVLLLFFWLNAFGVVGLAIDVTIVVTMRAFPLAWAFSLERTRRKRGALARLAAGVLRAGAIAFVVWLALVSVTAPWHAFWGSDAAELQLALPGDVPLGGRPPTYWIQHAVTIDAPPGAVWPWLAQLGTDKGGFYSYAFLERLFGIDVRNANRIHDEWQNTETGGFVLAAPAGYLGLDHPLGWRLTLVEPGRAMVLENWGAFVLLPAGEGATRFVVRTRNDQPPSLIGVALAWAGLTVFEPAHFLMERRMLLGVKGRAEGVLRASESTEPRGDAVPGAGRVSWRWRGVS